MPLVRWLQQNRPRKRKQNGDLLDPEEIDKMVRHRRNAPHHIISLRNSPSGKVARTLLSEVRRYHYPFPKNRFHLLIFGDRYHEHDIAGQIHALIVLKGRKPFFPSLGIGSGRSDVVRMNYW